MPYAVLSARRDGVQARRDNNVVFRKKIGVTMGDGRRLIDEVSRL
jgi:hypothetical protein